MLRRFGQQDPKVPFGLHTHFLNSCPGWASQTSRPPGVTLEPALCLGTQLQTS